MGGSRPSASSSSASSSSKRSPASMSNQSNRPQKNKKINQREATTRYSPNGKDMTSSPTSTITASTASPSSSLSSPRSTNSNGSLKSGAKKTSEAISNMTLKSPPEVKSIGETESDNESLASLRGEDGKLHLCKANLTNKYHLWVFVKRKNPGLTDQDKQCFLTADDHEDCLKDLYAASSPLELKMLYWQLCRNAEIDAVPTCLNWTRDQAGSAISKIVEEHWDKLQSVG